MFTIRAKYGVLPLALVALTLVACGDRGGAVSDSAGAMTGATTTNVVPTNTDDLDDRVERALEADTSLVVFGLDADDKPGKLVLKGVVRSAAQAAQALSVATGLAGTIPVESKIRIDAAAGTGAKPVDVDDLEEQVEDALKADSTLKGFDLDIDEENGTLVLEGKVQNAAQRSAAEALARRIAGSVTVVNRIKLD